MARLLALFIAASALQAAAIRGIVLDHYTGRPLARTLVTLEAVQAYGSAKISVRTGSSGQFAFSPLSPGAYLLTAARASFAVLKYGQKFWNSPGVPIVLSDQSSPFLDLRLHHLGAVTGTVWDENEIGIPDLEVYAYRAAKPPVLIGHDKTDDRGVYRIGGLAPGTYLVRAGSKQLDEETSVTPTFYKDSISMEEARTTPVELDQLAADVNIQPVFSKLFRLSGRVVAPLDCPGPMTVTLVSDMWSRTATTAVFSFDQLPRGEYELLAVCADAPPKYATYQKVFVDRDMEKIVQVTPVPIIQLTLQDTNGNQVDPASVSVFGRRKDLAGVGVPLQLKEGAPLLPGRWELTASVTGNVYADSISIPGPENRNSGRGDAWTEFQIAAFRQRLQVRVTVAPGVAGIHGRVTKSINEPAAGAPVYLEAIDPVSKQRLVDLRRALTDTRGDYRFTGLAPGSYRMVSSFEFDDPDDRMMESVRAPTVIAPAAGDAVQDLELYVRP
jgi:hypothetical protein